MPGAETEAKPEPPGDDPASVAATAPPRAAPTRRRRRFLPLLLTIAAVAVAVPLGRSTWDVYMQTPWTRDGTVRAYVVTLAPEVAGRVVDLRVVDNQFVRKGDLLLVIDPTNYRIAVSNAEAAVKQATADLENAKTEANRRRRLWEQKAVSAEELQIHETNAVVAQAQLQQALANRDQARVNLDRTQIRTPVNGWVTNLAVQLGDYATVGRSNMSIVDADSFWVDGYFEETALHAIREGDPAKIKLMGFDRIVRGHVAGIARGINVANAQANQQGLATVNPIFTWVRLAQRVPVRIHIDDVPDGVVLVAGMTATVQIDRRSLIDRGEAITSTGSGGDCKDGGCATK
jgi:RND family efflux transporter, MFP subunit